MTGSITCPRCGKTSHHPGDIQHRYCGRCHWWTSDRQLGALEVMALAEADGALQPVPEDVLAELPRFFVAPLRNSLGDHGWSVYDRVSGDAWGGWHLYRDAAEMGAALKNDGH